MGHIKTTEEGEKKLYYSRQCQLVWHAAVSPTHLPIHKKNKKTYSHLMASHWVISHRKQPARSPARSHVGPGQETQRSRETVGLVPPSVSAVGNLPVVPKKKKKKPASDAQHSAFINTHPETKAHVLTITPTFSPPALLALEPSCLIKSISCASAVPRQMTFKQVLLFGGEQMGVGAEFV